MNLAWHAAAIVAMDRRLLGDPRPCTGQSSAVKTGCWWASLIATARMFGSRH